MDNMNQYRAGFCNIGDREIRLRKRMLLVFAGITLFFSVCYILYRDSLAMLLLVFFTSAISFLIIMEIRQQFCVLFGIFNIYNFGKLGELKTVECKESSHKDRLRALRMITFSFLFAAVYVKILFFTCVFTGL